MLLASGVFSTEAFTALVAGAILAGVPLMFGALGELVSERAGVLNIGLEGMMLMGAYAGFVGAYYGHDEWAGFGAGMVAGAAVALVMVFFCVRLGLDVRRLIVGSFLISGLFVGLAAAAEILGIWGYQRSDYNPAFGLWVVPLVFLARLHPLGVIPYVFLLSVVSIGGDYAAQNAGLTPRFTLLLVGLTLLFMALTEWIARTRELSGSYLPGVAARRRRRAEVGR